MLLLCSAMSAVPVTSKNFLEMFYDFRHDGALCGLLKLTQAVGTAQCLCRAVFQNWINWARYS